VRQERAAAPPAHVALDARALRRDLRAEAQERVADDLLAQESPPGARTAVVRDRRAAAELAQRLRGGLGEGSVALPGHRDTISQSPG
jgi:hypothetical protein